jgi:polar amino acid transport system substrate-binding protein
VRQAAVAAGWGRPCAQADGLDDIKKAGKIRIAVDLGVPPYGMTDDKMQPTGSDIETAKALAKDWGLEFEHVPTTGASRIPALQTGKADLVISTLSITPERARVIDFSKGYAVLRTVIAAPKSVPLKSMADLDGKTVGTVRGTTHDTQLTKEGPKGMKLVRYEDDATEAQAFLSGQVDIFSTAELLVAPIDKKNPARQVEVKFVLDTSSSPSASRRTRSASRGGQQVDLPPTSRTASSTRSTRSTTATACRRHPEPVGTS